MAQFARPDSDVGAGAWTYSTGSTLFGCVDEASYDEADYIQLTNSAGSTCELGLSDVTDPASSSGHILRVRARKIGTGTITLTAALYQGSTEIMPLTTITLGSGFATTELTLTEAQANAITDYTDLRVRLYGVCNSASRYVVACWAELEVPAVSGSTYNETVTVARNAGLTDDNLAALADGISLSRGLRIGG